MPTRLGIEYPGSFESLVSENRHGMVGESLGHPDKALSAGLMIHTRIPFIHLVSNVDNISTGVSSFSIKICRKKSADI